MRPIILALCLTLSTMSASAQSLPEARCGDGVRSPGELCDDGNNQRGDGCDASCSTELPLKLPEKARRRALIGALVSYPLLLVLSPQLPDDNGAEVASVVGLATGLAPSLGHFYTRAYGRGALTAAARYLLNSGTALSIAFFTALNKTGTPSQENLNQELFLTSLFLLPSIALSIFDVRDAPRSIARMQKKGKYHQP